MSRPCAGCRAQTTGPRMYCAPCWARRTAVINNKAFEALPHAEPTDGTLRQCEADGCSIWMQWRGRTTCMAHAA